MLYEERKIIDRSKAEQEKISNSLTKFINSCKDVLQGPSKISPIELETGLDSNKMSPIPMQKMKGNSYMLGNTY